MQIPGAQETIERNRVLKPLLSKIAKPGYALAAALSVGVLGLSSAQAQTTLVTTRAGLAGNDFVDWGSLGSTNTNVVSPFNILSNNGVSLNVRDSGGTFQRRDQNNGWGGNFAAGDKLLWTAGANGPVTIALGTLEAGIGAQVQQDNFGAFNAQLAVYGAGNVLLNTFNIAGNSSSAGDNSAIFVGAVSNDGSAIIDHIVYTIGDNDFAINRLDLKSGSISNNAVPEPGALALIAGVGVSGASFAMSRLRRRRK